MRNQDEEPLNEWDLPEEPESDEEDPEAAHIALTKEMYYTAIIENIYNEDTEKRREAIDLICHFECDPRLEEPLMKLVRSTDARFVLSGIVGLGNWRHTDGAEVLIEMINHPTPGVLWDMEMLQEALIALGRIGGQEPLAFLKTYAHQRYHDHDGGEDTLGMAAIEAITEIATHGQHGAVEFLIEGCRSLAWNMREACADSFSVVYAGKEQLPKNVYETLVTLTKDENKNVRIAAYMSLDDIVGLDEKNKQILADARHKQVFGK
ncbi:MAG TPA: HEAT repeat domain-containing protein [bacterium]|nr:HEAT repeat domain-containing protein [bacterium]HMW37414.1 HEAT repeat domain-containing protein [bacterium]HMY37396.1 HEAT repeat domain-containing protein [bacterium]HMZ02938.1 HEAT repeat domain-containing protein [bacterium]HNB08955.1 HEAT repeat domain-containing protein [bacterium]